MPTFNVRDANAIVDKFQAADKFEAEIVPGRKHHKARIYYEGAFAAVFPVCHGHKDHNDIPNHLHINPWQAARFRQCMMSVKEYLEIVKKKRKEVVKDSLRRWRATGK